MIETLLALAVVLLLVLLALVVVLLRRPGADFSPAVARIEMLEKLLDRSERTVKDEFGRSRAEAIDQSRGLREDLEKVLTNSTNNLDRIARFQKERFDDFASV